MKTISSKLLLCLFLFAAWLMPCRGQTYDTYLTITGVTGEVTNGSMAILSFQWDMANPSAGAAAFSDLTVSKQVDAASPTLAYFCAGVSVRTSAVLTVKHHTTGNALYTITLGTVFITKVSAAGSADERPNESLSLTYRTIQWTYQKLDASGNTVGSPTVHSWDRQTNTGS